MRLTLGSTFKQLEYINGNLHTRDTRGYNRGFEVRGDICVSWSIWKWPGRLRGRVQLPNGMLIRVIKSFARK